MENEGKFETKKAGTFLLMKYCGESVPNQTTNSNFVPIICLFFSVKWGYMLQGIWGDLEQDWIGI